MKQPAPAPQTAAATSERLPFQIWTRLALVAQQVRALGTRFFAPYGVTPQQFLLLYALSGADDGMTQQALADYARVTKGNISQMMGVLERKGMIVRQADGAANVVILTAVAEQLLQEVEPLNVQLVTERLAVLSAAEQAQLLELLLKLEAGLAE